MIIGFLNGRKKENTLFKEQILLSNWCDEVFIDRSIDHEIRLGYLTELVNILRKGDTLLVLSLKEVEIVSPNLFQIWRRMQAKEIDFISIDEQINTTCKDHLAWELINDVISNTCYANWNVDLSLTLKTIYSF